MDGSDIGLSGACRESRLYKELRRLQAGSLMAEEGQGRGEETEEAQEQAVR